MDKGARYETGRYMDTREGPAGPASPSRRWLVQDQKIHFHRSPVFGDWKNTGLPSAASMPDRVVSAANRACNPLFWEKEVEPAPSA